MCIWSPSDGSPDTHSVAWLSTLINRHLMFRWYRTQPGKNQNFWMLHITRRAVASWFLTSCCSRGFGPQDWSDRWNRYFSVLLGGASESVLGEPLQRRLLDSGT